MHSILENKPCYFDYLPNELILKITKYCPENFVLLSKKFNQCICNDLERRWNSLKTNTDITDLSQKMISIEEHIEGAKGPELVKKFFSSLDPVQKLKNIDFSQLGDEMVNAWIINRDNNLCKCWPKIAQLLNIEIPLVNANQIRTWMLHKDNKQRLAQIEELNLSNLKLTSVPDEITYFSGLINLQLGNNQLTCLPDSIGNLTKLQYLVLMYNQLTDLPDSIGALTELKELDIEYNKLTRLPNSLVDVGKNASGYLTLYLDGNILMLIPNCILDKFESNTYIKQFKHSLMNRPSHKLDWVCQMIRRGSERILNNNFNGDETLKDLIGENRWYSIFEDHLAKDATFGNLVDELDVSDQHLIYSRIGRVIAKEKDRNNVSSLKNTRFRDIIWGKQNRFKNMRLFVSILGELMYKKAKKIDTFLIQW